MLEFYYKVLGLDMSATIDDVKKRYRELSKNKDVNLKKIKEAYRIIMINLYDRCSNYEKLFNYADEDIINMSTEELKNLIDNIDKYIGKIGNSIEKLNKSQTKYFDVASLYNLQSKIITTKYKIELDALESNKAKEKLNKCFLYYLIPTWKNSFEKKYLAEERKLKEKWENDFDYIIFKVYYWMLKSEKAGKDIDKMTDIIIDLCNRKNRLSKELKNRNLKVKKK